MTRSLHIAYLDKLRPVVVLTRAHAVSHLREVTVAAITSTVRGLSTEVAVGPDNGLDHDSVINCDQIVNVPPNVLGPPVGRLTVEQEAALTKAVHAAFDLL